jgi:hypothetical protein
MERSLQRKREEDILSNKKTRKNELTLNDIQIDIIKSTLEYFDSYTFLSLYNLNIFYRKIIYNPIRISI